MTVEPGYITEKPAVLARLRRIEGQIRGLQRLVDDERYCIDILTQVSAATKALEGVALMLLDQHLQHCLAKGTDPDEAHVIPRLQPTRSAITVAGIVGTTASC